MIEKRFYWLKLQNDFFSSLRIKKLRKLAGGDTFTIIYLKMQLLSLQNGGRLEYKGIEPTFEDEMALELDEDVENVKITIQYLLASDLLYCSGDEYELPYVIANTGSETSSAERVRKHREKQKTLHCNTDVTIGNTEIEIRDREREEIDIYPEQVVELYNSICKSLSSVQKLSEARKRTIKTRLNKYSLDDFKDVFERAEASDFLKGSTGWKANFDWLINESNMIKVMEGNYTNRSKKNGFNNFKQNATDYDDIERRFLIN